jgi:hypothetical protein
VRELPNKIGFFPTIATFDAAKGTNKWAKKQKPLQKMERFVDFMPKSTPKVHSELMF